MKFKSLHVKRPQKERSFTEYTAETFSLKMEAFLLDKEPSGNDFQIIIREMLGDRLFFSDPQTTLDKCRKRIEDKARKYQQVLEFLNKIENES